MDCIASVLAYELIDPTNEKIENWGRQILVLNSLALYFVSIHNVTAALKEKWSIVNVVISLEI